jgi:membrane associated rhomboid family serine protease/Zn-finger nucleic acid-binding protein
MFICPNCQSELIRKLAPNGVFWECAQCGGRDMGMGLLRQSIDGKVAAAIWAQTCATPNRPGKPCAVCSRAMLEVEIQVENNPMKLDVCRTCEFVWFDSGKFELIPPFSPRPRPLGQLDETTLPLDAREALAMIKVREIAKQAQKEDPTPDQPWKAIPVALGLPIEMDSSDQENRAWATYGSAALITAVSVPAFFHLRPIVDNWGLIPAQAYRHDGLTLLTSFFLHGGIVHLLGNLYFLVVFGRRVEAYLNWCRWLGLLLLATIVGDFLHIAADPFSTVPCIGASGGISGVITFYALKFPMESLGIFYYRLIALPAWSAFLLWVLFQIWGAYQQVHGFSNVSAMAHLGGTAVGIAAWLLWRNLDAARRFDPTLARFPTQA